MAEERIKVDASESVLSVSSESNVLSTSSATCSRCLAIRTVVEPFAWTLSTLRQTGHTSVKPSRSLRSESIDALTTTELLRQYRLLQVCGGVWRERVEASLVHPEQLSVRGGGVRVASHHH